MLHVVGRCDARIFGLDPAVRLRRQRGGAAGPVLVARSSAVLSDAAVSWLLDHPGTILVSPRGAPLAVAADGADIERASQALIVPDHQFPTANPETLPPVFVRKLRRRDRLFARSLDEEPAPQVEQALFQHVYKGVTDIITRYIWPVPALWTTRLLSRARVTPNMVSLFNVGLTVLAALLWYQGALAAGLAVAWAVTFLDTVDGKLARVTVTSSSLGNLLDHVNDYLHPPIWWICLAAGLAQQQGAHAAIWSACWVILGAYAVGRAIEELFKARIGYNQYLWRRFDSLFRLVVSRRNVILLIMTVGLILGFEHEAFVACAIWSVISVAVQAVRLVQALTAARRSSAESWLM